MHNSRSAAGRMNLCLGPELCSSIEGLSRGEEIGVKKQGEETETQGFEALRFVCVVD